MSEMLTKATGFLSFSGFFVNSGVYEGREINKIVFVYPENKKNITIEFDTCVPDTYNTIENFLKKYNLTEAQLKVSKNILYNVEYVHYEEHGQYVLKNISVDDKELIKFIKNKDIAEYAIPVYFEVSGKIYIYGTSLEDAINRANNASNEIPLPKDTEYMEGSFEIADVDVASQYNYDPKKYNKKEY